MNKLSNILIVSGIFILAIAGFCHDFRPPSSFGSDELKGQVVDRRWPISPNQPNQIFIGGNTSNVADNQNIGFGRNGSSHRNVDTTASLCDWAAGRIDFNEPNAGFPMPTKDPNDYIGYRAKTPNKNKTGYFDRTIVTWPDGTKSTIEGRVYISNYQLDPNAGYLYKDAPEVYIGYNSGENHVIFGWYKKAELLWYPNK